MIQTSYSTIFALYHLACSPEAQEKLHKEAVTLIPDREDSLTAEALRSASYTKAAIKETFRLNPISVGIGRILKNDVVLGGYHVPKGASIFFRFFNFSQTFSSKAKRSRGISEKLLPRLIFLFLIITDCNYHTKPNHVSLARVFSWAGFLHTGKMDARQRKFGHKKSGESPSRVAFRTRR